MSETIKKELANPVVTPTKPLACPEDEYKALLHALDTYMPQADRKPISQAYEFAAQCHSHQKRASGEPYICHPLAVAGIVATLKLDTQSIVAAILHDTVEDTTATLEDIERLFGAEVKDLVDGLTKISKIKFRSNEEKLAENFRKMIVAMAKDLRVILIKLCDRMHNMRTIDELPVEKRKRIAQETMDIYAPLANRLGIYGIKSELEDLCLRVLKYEVYQDLRRKIAAKKSQRLNYINEVKQVLEVELNRYGFTSDTQVYGRPKHFYSIYKKMTERHLEFEDIHDLFAFRIIVANIKDCYEALGVVHSMWKPMPGRFKDYIAMPKANLYQSLHTTVIRPNGETAEIQIRTKEMHETCEYGVAAHWSYKEKDRSHATDAQKFSWLRQIMQWQSELKDPDEFLEAIKVDLFDEEIFVFTPKGDVLSLPMNATALDFAFAVHTNVGQKCIGVKVNGQMSPIKKRLHSGDIVEVLTSPHQKPSKDWLNFVVTSKARNKIRSSLRTETRDKSKKLGQELLAQELDKRNMSLDALEKNGEAAKLVKQGRESTLEDLLIAIGYGRLNARDLIAKTFPAPEPKETIQEQIHRQGLDQAKPEKPQKSGHSSILVSGHGDVLVNIGKCCMPLPGEGIVGFITRGRGVTVHRSTCPRALDLDPNMKLPVEWSKTAVGDNNYHRCSISLKTHEKPGVLADVTAALSNNGVNVHKAEAKIESSVTGLLEFEIGVKNLSHLETVISRLESLPAVISVQRKNLVKQQRRLRRGRFNRAIS